MSTRRFLRRRWDGRARASDAPRRAGVAVGMVGTTRSTRTRAKRRGRPARPPRCRAVCLRQRALTIARRRSVVRRNARGRNRRMRACHLIRGRVSCVPQGRRFRRFADRSREREKYRSGLVGTRTSIGPNHWESNSRSRRSGVPGNAKIDYHSRRVRWNACGKVPSRSSHRVRTTDRLVLVGSGIFRPCSNVRDSSVPSDGRVALGERAPAREGERPPRSRTPPQRWGAARRRASADGRARRAAATAVVAATGFGFGLAALGVGAAAFAVGEIRLARVRRGFVSVEATGP